MTISFKEYKDKNYAIITVPEELEIIKLLNDSNRKVFVSSEDLSSFIKHISFLLDDNDKLYFTSKDEGDKNSVVYIKRFENFVINVEKFNKDHYKTSVSFYNSEDATYSLTNEDCTYEGGIESCVNKLTNILSDGKSVLNNI